MDRCRHRSGVRFVCPPAVAVRALLLIGALLQLAACADEPLGPASNEPAENGEPAGPAVVSDPSPATAPASSVAVADLAVLDDDEFAWISFPPSTYAGATEARLQNLRSGKIAVSPILDGGLDPVPVPSSVGDSIEVIVLAGQTMLARATYEVPRRRPPVVIRTNPPRGRKDVPLNSVIRIVFSEPIDQTSVHEGSIRLTGDGAPIPIQLETSLDGLWVELITGQDLAPATRHEITVTQEVTDRSGDTLQEELRIDFETSAAPPEPAAEISPENLVLAAGTTVQLAARLSAAGKTIARAPDGWTSSNPAVATVAHGLVTALSEGVADIEATFGEIHATATITVETASGVVLASITGGGSHTCGTTISGDAWCWGSNAHGQLGSPAGGIGSGSVSPVIVETSIGFVSLAAGDEHTCGITAEGFAHCWGRNHEGQLGDGSTTHRAEPVPVAGSERFAVLAAGSDFTCGLTFEGVTFCWGSNAEGQLGTVGPGSTTPVRIAGSPRFGRIAVGPNHACGVTPDGTRVLCWGGNSNAQLGQDTSAVRFSALPVENAHLEVVYDQVAPVASVSAGGGHSCIAASPGRPYGYGYANWWCWGVDVDLAADADYGGGDDLYCVLAGEFVPCEEWANPIDNGGIVPTSPASLASGDGHGCALSTTGEVYCWGRNEYGQRGDGSGGAPTHFPQLVTGLSFTAVAAGTDHTCGVTRSGSTYCWGRNAAGQLGNGTSLDADTPVEVVF